RCRARGRRVRPPDQGLWRHLAARQRQLCHHRGAGDPPGAGRPHPAQPCRRRRRQRPHRRAGRSGGRRAGEVSGRDREPHRGGAYGGGIVRRSRPKPLDRYISEGFFDRPLIAPATIHQSDGDGVARFAFRYLPSRKAVCREFAPTQKAAPMQWISERDATDAALTHHALVLEANDPIEPAYVEFWKRILADGCAHGPGSGWQSLSVEICERQTEADDQGYMHLKFRDGQHRACAGVAEYFLRSDAFTCLEVAGEDRIVERRRQLGLFLDQYTLLKAAVAAPEVQPLLAYIDAVHPLMVEAAAGFGWFDLQIGKATFGPLSAEDRATLEGRKA